MLVQTVISTVVGSAISGIIGNRVDNMAMNTMDLIIDNFDKNKRLINHDLQKAVLRSYYLALKSICEECRSKGCDSESIKSWSEDQIEEIKKILGKIDKNDSHFFVVEDIDNIKLFITTDQNMEDEINSQKEKLVSYALDLDSPPQNYIKLVKDTLYQRVCGFFAFEIKHNQVVSNIFQGQILSNIDIKVSRIADILMNDIISCLPEFRESLSKIEQVVDKNQKSFEEVLAAMAGYNESTGSKLDIIINELTKLSNQVEVFSVKENVNEEETTQGTEIAITTLKKNSRKYYERITGISSLLYQSRTYTSIYTNVSIDQVIMKGTEGLRYLWSKNCWHALVEGDGGMGKTTMLLNYWKMLNEIEEKGPLPIYIPLHEYKGEENFIQNKISEIYLQNTDDPGILQRFIELKELVIEDEKEVKPSVVLLLDGFNEISKKSEFIQSQMHQVIQQNHLIKEIEDLVLNSGVQIIISARTDIRNENLWDYINKVEMIKLTDQQLKAFFEEIRLTADIIIPSGELLELVRNPMMLAIYCEICSKITRYSKNEHFLFRQHVKSQGELLWNYFETQKVKIYEKRFSESETIMRRFLIEHVMPYIAFYMQRENRFSIRVRELDRLIKEAFNRLDEEVFKYTFDSYISLSESKDQISIETIKKILCQEMNFFVTEKGTRYGKRRMYVFFHQVFRDYMSAVHLFNEILLLIESFDNDLLRVDSHYNLPISVELQKLLGEVLGEHYNKPVLRGQAWAVDHYYEHPFSDWLNELMNQLRTALPVEEQKPFHSMIKNTVGIYQVSRGELTGADLSGLNLLSINLNGIICSRKGRNGYVCAEFEGALIDENDFMPHEDAHKLSIRCACYGFRRNTVLTASEDFTIKEWDRETGELRRTYSGHTDKVYWAVYNEDETKILSSSWDMTVKEWSTQDGSCLCTYNGHTEAINMAIYDSSESHIISAGDDLKICIWNVNEDKKISNILECNVELLGHKGWVNSVYSCVIGGQEKVLSTSADGTVRLWDMKTFDSIIIVNEVNKKIRYAVLNNDLNTILLAFENSQMAEYSLDGQLKREYTGHQSFVRTACYDELGDMILSASDDSTIKLWEIDAKYNKHRSFVGHKGMVYTAVFDTKNSRILSSSEDGTAKEWDIESQQCLKTYSSHYHYGIQSAVYNHNEDIALLACTDGTIMEWSLTDNKCLGVYIGHRGKVNSAKYNDEETRILSASVDNTIKEWDRVTGECINTYAGHNGIVYSAVYGKAQNGASVILSASADGTVKAWIVDQVDSYTHSYEHPSRVYKAVYNSAFNRIFCACRDGNIYEWLLNEDSTSMIHRAHYDVVESVHLFECREYEKMLLVSASNDKSYVLWNVTEDEMLTKDRSVNVHQLGVVDIDFAPSRGTIISASRDKTIGEYSIEDSSTNVYIGHEHWVNSVKYSHDYSRILSSSADGTAREWSVGTKKPQTIISHIPGLFIQGCDFEKIDRNSKITRKDVFRKYQAKI